MSLAELALYSEPYGSTGNMGPNSLRLLGTPALDPLHALVRESVQNIADAARLGVPARVLFRIRTLGDTERTAMRERVLAHLPEEEDSRGRLQTFLEREHPAVLEICDFGTVGLGGPTRADRVPGNGETADFVNFLWNVGSLRDVPDGGGTYGFGKAALYRASRCSTILVDSLVTGGGDRGHRLIASHIGESFSSAQGGVLRPYTGRHWWGVRSHDGTGHFLEPLFDIAARELAAALGMPVRTATESGTTIMILDFDLEGIPVETVGWRLVETLLWNFWPRMLDTTPAERRLDCRVEVNGRSLTVPEPEQTAPLNLFAKAMTAARIGAGETIRSPAPQEGSRDARHRKSTCWATRDAGDSEGHLVPEAVSAHRAHASGRTGSEVPGGPAAA